MKWPRLVVVAWISIGSMAAWGQATAEYGLAASKSAAATAATLDKLNRSSSAALAAAGATASRAADAGARKTAPAAPAKTAPRAHRHPQAQATPAPAEATTRKLQPSGISLSRGSAATERKRETKYPGIVDIGASANSSERAPTTPTKPPQP